MWTAESACSPPCNNCGVGNPPPPPPPQQPVNFPNETNGLPNGFPTNPWGIWGAIIPTAQCGDITCASIGNGLELDPEEIAIGAGFCALNPEICTTVAIAGLGIAAWEKFGPAIVQMAKGGSQNIVPSWAEGATPVAGESAAQMANRLCKQQYPPDGAGCGSGPGSERNKIRKWAHRKWGI